MRLKSFLDVYHKTAGTIPSEKTKSHVRDISRDGMRISGENPLLKKSLVEVEVSVPGDNFPIQAFGEVMWSKKASKWRHDTGMRFTKISPADRSRLIDAVYYELVKIREEALT